MPQIEVCGWIITPFDNLNWVVQKPVKGDDGNQRVDSRGLPRWKDKHYFPKLEMAFAFVLTKRLEETVRDDVKSVLHAIERARSEIMAAVGSLQVGQPGDGVQVVQVASVPVYDIG